MEFLTIAKDFGIPIALLIFLCFAIWKVLIWLGQNVVKPLTDRHIAFIDKIEKSILEQADNVKVLTTKSTEATEQNKENAKHIRDVIDQIKDIRTGVDDVRGVVLKASVVQIIPSSPKDSTR